MSEKKAPKWFSKMFNKPLGISVKDRINEEEIDRISSHVAMKATRKFYIVISVIAAFAGFTGYKVINLHNEAEQRYEKLNIKIDAAAKKNSKDFSILLNEYRKKLESAEKNLNKHLQEARNAKELSEESYELVRKIYKDNSTVESYRNQVVSLKREIDDLNLEQRLFLQENKMVLNKLIEKSESDLALNVKLATEKFENETSRNLIEEIEKLRHDMAASKGDSDYKIESIKRNQLVRIPENRITQIGLHDLYIKVKKISKNSVKGILITDSELNKLLVTDIRLPLKDSIYTKCKNNKRYRVEFKTSHNELFVTDFLFASISIVDCENKSKN